MPNTRQPRKIRYTDAEWASIVQRAHACRRPPARYVRETSLGAIPKGAHHQQDDEVIHELGRIGVTLRRLAVEARDPPTLEVALGELLATVRRLG